MNGLDLNNTNKFIVEKLTKRLGENLFAVISTGSVASKNYKKSWSDIDILIVVVKIELKTKRIIAETINSLSKKFKQRFGINVISKKNAESPILPSQSLNGKTLQALLDLKTSPERMLFCKIKEPKFYYPDEKEIKQYSLLNIGILVLNNRRNLTMQVPKTIEEYKRMVEKTIRLAFIITKLSIQYFNLTNCITNRDIVNEAQKLFKDFKFDVLKRNLRIISRWSNINNYSYLGKTLQLTDDFIEKFSYYVFTKTKK
jgi:predicted nucleotidyltransferase